MLANRCKRALERCGARKMVSQGGRKATGEQKRKLALDYRKKALLMDANGILYSRNEKKMEALSRFLTETGRYEPGSVDLRMLAIQASTIANVRSDANKGVVSAEQYYMTLLLTLPINPVDYAGALNAIRGAEYNISIFPDTQDALMTLKHHHNVKLGVVTDSMSSTTEKKKWMEGAGLNTDLFDVIVNSSDMGTCKPDPIMYQKALTSLGVEPNEAAFLGHRGTELKGAADLGMTTLVMFPDSDLLLNRGAALSRFDFYIPSWKHVPRLDFWLSKDQK